MNLLPPGRPWGQLRPVQPRLKRSPAEGGRGKPEQQGFDEDVVRGRRPENSSPWVPTLFGRNQGRRPHVQMEVAVTELYLVERITSVALNDNMRITRVVGRQK
jgi:hypothetical protein